MIKRNIPNAITLCNLLCGTISAWCAATGDLQNAALFILLGILFDFFDGMVARLLNVASPMGKELDSLADLVTSGVAPAFILFYVLRECLAIGWLACVAFLIPVAAGFRLAKFNLDTRQSHSFLGLPAPSNALVWVAVGLLYGATWANSLSIVKIGDVHAMLFSGVGPYLLVFLAVLCSALMVSEIPLFALKFKNLSWKDNSVRFVFIISSILLLLLFGVIGVMFVILWYVILSLISGERTKQLDKSK